jgi:topoisomerase-4 subunit B
MADGSAIFNEIVYLFSKFARFLLDHEMVYRALSPLFRGYSKTTGKLTYYYPDDPFDPKTSMPVDLDTKKHFDRWKGLSSLTPETGEVYDSFYNPATRRLVLVTPEGIDYSRSLNENIENRKKLLFDRGILSNPYNFTDL